jgi:LuxR family maltose regulon positive regulatory protein
MHAPILNTKTHIPLSRPYAVLRPRLSEQLTAGVQGKLTLISAPAGFGKTTLLSEWVAASEEPAAWLSLDEEHSDPARFLVYFVAALRTLALPSVDMTSQLGEGVLRALQASQPSALDAILTPLINELAAVSSSFILILDDYHLVESQSVDQTLSFMLRHLPPSMHLVIATREDPSLPLARLRARGQLTELRAHDLRFTQNEAAEFLNQAMGLNLSAEDIAALENRTEGWIAGLQLAALALQGVSLQGHQDTAGFINSFSGSHQFVLDYLVEEVLQQQPESIQYFLLSTSILERLCGSLCDALLPEASQAGQEILETLERANLLLVPLDKQRNWFRYHHLFADALRVRLTKAHPDDVVTLHRRACAWYGQHELYRDAIRHALAAKDFACAAELIELARPTLEKGSRDKITLRWVQALPDAVVDARPTLKLAYAWARLDAGELEAARDQLEDVERWLASMYDAAPTESGKAESNKASVTEVQARSLSASLATAWVYYAKAVGDTAATVKYAERALDRLPEDDHLRQAQIAGLLALAYWANGDLEAAQHAMLHAETLAQKTGSVRDTIDGAFVMADIEVVLGRLGAAVHLYEDALQLAAEHGDPTSLGLATIYAGLSGLRRERNDLAAAAQDLATSETFGERIGDRVWRYRWSLAKAGLKETLGDWGDALDLLNEAERIYIRSPLPDVRPIAALRTRVWVKQNRLTAALGWARGRSLSVDDNLHYLREFEHMTLARVLIAQHRDAQQRNIQADDAIPSALQLLTRLRQAAEAGGRTGSVIEILVMQALAHEAQAGISAALVALEQALTLAEPEGYVRTFVDEGPPMAHLLRALADQGKMSVYTGKLLAAFEHTQEKLRDDDARLVNPPAQSLIEPLSARELDVLRLFKTELSGPEIADTLMIALSTVRTHTKSIYGKLNVNNRRAAVNRAEELELI